VVVERDAGSTRPLDDAGVGDAGVVVKGPFDAGAVVPVGPVPGEVTFWQLELGADRRR
jgi:hypothetical protein